MKAYIALKDGFKEKVSVDEIIQFCRKRISAYKAPTFVEFLNEIPKSSTGKILRRTLRKEKWKMPKQLELRKNHLFGN